MRTLLLDLRYAVRMLRTHPGISLIAVLSLTLGIGATSTIFSLVDGMYLRPFAVRDPEGLLWLETRTAEGRSGGLAWLDYLELKDSVQAFSDVAAQSRRGGQVEGEGEPETVQVTVVTDNYFPLLGVTAARGRLFQRDLDEAMANEPAIAIGDSLWRRRYGADPSLIGRSIRLNGRAFTVVGVLPPDFRGLNRGVRTDVWVPVSTWKAMGNRREFEERGSGVFEGLARLRPGASLDQARAQLESFRARLEQERPDAYRGRRFKAATEQERQARGGPKPTVLLLSTVALVVLIACANVAMLLLAQAEGRNREISVRLALGAGRGRLVRQFLTEGLLLAVASGGLALLVARWLIPVLPALLPPGPGFARFDIRTDGRVLVVTLLTCVATVLLFGLAPALKAATTDLMAALKGRGFESRKTYAGRNLLVAVQAGLAVVLIAAAAMLARSFLNVRHQRLGFDTDKNTLILFTVIPAPRNATPSVSDEIVGRIRSLPGVELAAYGRRVPLGLAGGGATREVVIPGHVAAPGEELIRIRYNQVSADFLAVAGTQVLAGRALTPADSATGVRVALVNQTMARRFWPDGRAVDRWVRVDGTDTLIVGVVEDCVVSSVHEPPEPFMIFPFAQLPVNEVTFLVQTAGAPGPSLDLVKREMRAARPGLVVLHANTLRQHVRDALYPDWLPAVLSAAIGLLGIILAAAGFFGVVLHGVNRRLGEIGVRMALGARSRNVMTLVLKHGLILAGSGAAAGVLAAIAGGRVISGILYGVNPRDPGILLISVAVVLAMAATASLYPAWKAARVDPAVVLRAE